MKRLILSLVAVLALSVSSIEAKDLVVYFSATGNTKAVAEEIARQTGADILRIEAAEPYAANPYDDSDRVKDESYNDKRPGVANLPSADFMAQYDRIFVGSPIWWHQPAMVVCTFLEAFDLTGKTIVPFFTYGATTYLNESMHKIYKVTPNSHHVPEMLPEDLNPDDITTPGPADDSGIDMPGNARGVKSWLERLGLIGDNSAIDNVTTENAVPFTLRFVNDVLLVSLSDEMKGSSVEIHTLDGTLLQQHRGEGSYVFQLPRHTTSTVSVRNARSDRRFSQKVYVR